MKHPMACVALLLCGIVAVSGAFTLFFASPPEQTFSTTVVASFYPVYVSLLNVAGGVDGVRVENLLPDLHGCAHDVQLSPALRATLASADILVCHGAGAEPFLDDARRAEPDLAVIDLSEGLSLPQTAGEEANAHLWVSPVRARAQIEALRDGLIRYDPSHAAAYRDNAAAYLRKIDALHERLTAAAAALNGTPVAVYHDSLSYLAADYSLRVIGSLEIGEESGASAARLREAEDALRGQERALFLTDSQYDATPYAYLQSIPREAVVCEVDTCVSPKDGVTDADRWLVATESLCAAWKEAGA